MTEDSDPETVEVPAEEYDRILKQAERNTTLSINESADKIVLKTSVKRGSGTRDQDKTDVKVKGDDPEVTAAKLKRTLDALEDNGVAETLRETQPGETEE